MNDQYNCSLLLLSIFLVFQANFGLTPYLSVFLHHSYFPSLSLAVFQVTHPPWAEQQAQLLGSFDEKAYLASKQLKAGEDPYREHAFNLQESDRLGSERAIRDTRHYR